MNWSIKKLQKGRVRVNEHHPANLFSQYPSLLAYLMLLIKSYRKGKIVSLTAFPFKGTLLHFLCSVIAPVLSILPIGFVKQMTYLLVSCVCSTGEKNFVLFELRLSPQCSIPKILCSMHSSCLSFLT